MWLQLRSALGGEAIGVEISVLPRAVPAAHTCQHAHTDAAAERLARVHARTHTRVRTPLRRNRQPLVYVPPYAHQLTSLQVSSVFCALNTHKLVSAEQAGVRVKLGVVAVSRRLLVQMARCVSACARHALWACFRRGIRGGDEGLGEGDPPCPVPLPLRVPSSFSALSFLLLRVPRANATPVLSGGTAARTSAQREVGGAAGRGCRRARVAERADARARSAAHSSAPRPSALRAPMGASPCADAAIPLSFVWLTTGGSARHCRTQRKSSKRRSLLM